MSKEIPEKPKLKQKVEMSPEGAGLLILLGLLTGLVIAGWAGFYVGQTVVVALLK